MNRQIVKLFGFIAVLFAVLVAFTSYWSVFDAEALRDKQANKRPLLEAQQIERGRILSADGEVVARSVPKGQGDARRYVRRYPEGALYGHPIGYSFVQYGDTEFEAFHNEELIGEGSEFASIVDELTGAIQEGNDVVTNLDSGAQRTALSELEAAGFGAVVAIEPKSGRVRVMASNKPYDPNRIPEEFGELSQNELETPLLNRATQGLYPPGSTFKVVSAASALENDVITPETTIAAPATLDIETKPLSNFGGSSYPPVPLDFALTNSINTWFAQVGEDLGGDALLETMREFGFGSSPPIDLPNGEVYASGVLGDGGLLGPGDPVDVGRVAIGQERLLTTPLQMAMVASAVANGGSLMRPQIWSRVVDPDGRTTEKLDRSEYSEPISAETASELTTAMEDVVSEGTGTNARIEGIAVAGKTGTAETPGNKSCLEGDDENQAWFIGFAPAEDPEVAIAVSVECTPGFGGDVAAPIFRSVAEALLDGE